MCQAGSCNSQDNLGYYLFNDHSICQLCYTCRCYYDKYILTVLIKKYSGYECIFTGRFYKG